MKRARALGAIAALAAVAIVRCSGDDSTQSCGPADATCDDVVPTPLAMSIVPQEIWIAPGAAQTIAVSLVRGPGGTGDVAVTIESDAGLTLVADPLTIPDGSTTGNLTLHAPVSTPQGTSSLTVDAQTANTLAQAALVVHVRGASGTLDTSFANAGTADLTPSTGQDLAAAMIVFQNGVVVGGTHVETSDGGSTSTMKVMRLANGGGLDSTFQTTTANALTDLRSLAMLANEEVYAVGDFVDTKSEFAAVRVLASGGLDPKYAVVTPISLGDDVAYAGAIEPGGQLVAAGSANDAGAIAVARYTQSSTPLSDASPVTSELDPSFADGGVLSVALAKPIASASSLLVAPDGSLYVLGRQSDGTSTDVAFLHVTTAGAVDTTMTVPLTSGQIGAASALLDPDGTILVASDDGGQALVMRLLASGALDSTFGASGRATFGSQAAARAVARDPSSGDVLAGGAIGAQCLLARLTPQGALDATFATSGTLSIAQGDACAIVAIGVDDNGLIDVLENVTNDGASHMSVSRYWP